MYCVPYLNVLEISELSRCSTAESGWHEQTADCYKPVDIWEVDQADRYVQNSGEQLLIVLWIWQ